MSIYSRFGGDNDRPVWKISLGILFLLLMAGCASAPRLSFPDKTGRLIVDVSGFRNDEGVAILSLFDKDDGFPDDMERALSNQRVKIRSGRVQAVFSGLPYGKYALSILHDENNDGLMQKSFFNSPREGFGFSGKQDTLFGPPDFDDASFLMISERRELPLQVRYETLRSEKRSRNQAEKLGKPE